MVAFALILSACKSEAKHEPPAPVPSPPEPSPKKTTELVRVDRDQLAALCVAAGLPRASMGSTYGALKLADGGRVPWLTIRSEAAAWMPGDVQPLAAKEWIARASAWMDQQASLIEGGRHHRREPMRGDVWMSMPCTHEEALWVVVSGAFFDTDAYHAVALRAGRVLHETFPTTSDRSAVFVRAIELTKKVLGTDSLEIAPHTVEDTTRPSVHDDTWGSAISRAMTPPG